MKFKFWLFIIFSLLYFMTSNGFRDCTSYERDEKASKEFCTDIILPNSECCFDGEKSCFIYYEDFVFREKHQDFVNSLEEESYQECIAYLNSLNYEGSLQCKTSIIKIDNSKISITEDQYNKFRGERGACSLKGESIEDEKQCFQRFILPESKKKGMECCYIEMQLKEDSSQIGRYCYFFTKFERSEAFLSFFFAYYMIGWQEGLKAFIRVVCNDFKLELDYEKLSFCGRQKPFINKITRQCVEKCTFNETINNNCILGYRANKEDENEKNLEIKIYDTFLEDIETYFISENYNTTNLENGNDESFELGKIKITLTTSENQYNNQNNSISTINLGKCEDLLKEYYKISHNEKIYMKKIDIHQERLEIYKIEFDIYQKLNGKLNKLNKIVCKNETINLNIPFETDKNLDEFNISSEYYKDLCYIAKSDNGTDISLYVRKKYFKIVCQDNCFFINYNDTTKQANCICNIQITPKSIIDMDINITKLFENIPDIKNIANIGLLKCYQNLFSKNGILYNIGFCVSMIILIIHIHCMIIFYKKQFKKIRKQIKDIIFSIKNIELINLNENENNKPKKEILNKSNKLSNKILHEKKKRNLQKNNQHKNNININITQSSTLNYINNNIIKREKKKYNSQPPKKKIKKV